MFLFVHDDKYFPCKCHEVLVFVSSFSVTVIFYVLFIAFFIFIVLFTHLFCVSYHGDYNCIVESYNTVTYGLMTTFLQN